MIIEDQSDIDAFVFCAFRYAIGRRTYIVATVTSLLIKYKDAMTTETKLKIKSEADRAIKQGLAGTPQDVVHWLEIVEEL